MPTASALSSGSILERGDGATVEVFTAVASVRRVSLGGLSSNLVESTGLETTGNFRTYFATLKDGGSLSFTLNYLPTNAGHEALIADWKSGALRNFRLKLGNPLLRTIAISAIVSGVDFALEPETQMQSNVSLKISGEPIWS